MEEGDSPPTLRNGCRGTRTRTPRRIPETRRSAHSATSGSPAGGTILRLPPRREAPRGAPTIPCATAADEGFSSDRVRIDGSFLRASRSGTPVFFQGSGGAIMLFGVWWINRRGEGERRVRQEAHVPFDNGP